MPDGTYTQDEPYAFQAREFLRTKLVGKEVLFRVEYRVPFGERHWPLPALTPFP